MNFEAHLTCFKLSTQLKALYNWPGGAAICPVFKDIAITENKPIIVEANRKWGCCVNQYISDSHKPLFDKYFSHLLKKRNYPTH